MTLWCQSQLWSWSISSGKRFNAATAVDNLVLDFSLWNVSLNLPILLWFVHTKSIHVRDVLVGGTCDRCDMSSVNKRSTRVVATLKKRIKNPLPDLRMQLEKEKNQFGTFLCGALLLQGQGRWISKNSYFKRSILKSTPHESFFHLLESGIGPSNEKEWSFAPSNCT